jgi:formiminoglutamase
VELRQRMLLSDFAIKSSSDLFTDQIFSVPNAYIVKANISRLVADPNRAPDDIEMESHLCAEGVVVSIDENGKLIYRKPPSEKMISERVAKYHADFHAQIDRITSKVKFLIDGHSMWSRGMAKKVDAGKMRADICLGNRDFTTCSRVDTLKIYEFFKKQNFSVALNQPYSGKFILGSHCSRKGLPGVQVEFSRKLYMHEKTLRPRQKDLKKLNRLIAELVDFIAAEIVKN